MNADSELRQNDIFFDAVIRVDDGTEFTVHRAILSAYSEFFRALFRWKNPNSNSYKLSGVSGPAMSLVLDFIYNSKCSIDRTNMLELLVAGDYLGVLDLVKYCEDFVISAIARSNCIMLMHFGKDHNYPRIYEVAKHFILDDFEHLMAVKYKAMLDLTFD